MPTIIKCSLTRVHLNSGGYTSQGHYYGIGMPLFHAYDESRNIDRMLRATNRERAVAILQHDYPGIVLWRD